MFAVQGVSLCVFWLLTGAPAEAATLRGRVISSSGFGIPQVRVTLTAESETTGGSQVSLSDQNGEFLSPELPLGSYSLTAEKASWQPIQMRLHVAETSFFAPPHITVTMEPTPLAYFLNRLQLGSVIYVWLFGLLILVFNFYFVPEAAKGVTAFGWACLALAASISVVKLHWYESAMLTTCGLGVASLIHRQGTALAIQKSRQEQKELEQHAETTRGEDEQRQSLVGQQGMTLTDLKTHGQIRVGDLELSGRAACGYLRHATPVVIVRMEGDTAVVEACQAPARETST